MPDERGRLWAITDTVEKCARGHAWDDLVGIAGRETTLRAAKVAMRRLNVPSVIIYGGSILPCRSRGREVTMPCRPIAFLR